MYCNIVSHLWFVFSVSYSIFHRADIFKVNKPVLTIFFCFIDYTFGVCLKTHCQTPNNVYFYVFFSNFYNFSFWANFPPKYKVCLGSFYKNMFSTFFLKIFNSLFPFNCFCSFFKGYVTKFIRGYFQAFSSALLFYVFILSPISLSFIINFLVSLQVG